MLLPHPLTPRRTHPGHQNSPARLAHALPVRLTGAALVSCGILAVGSLLPASAQAQPAQAQPTQTQASRPDQPQAEVRREGGGRPEGRPGGPSSFGEGMANHPDMAKVFTDALRKLKPDLIEAIDQAAALSLEERKAAYFKLYNELSSEDRQRLRQAIRSMFEERMQSRGDDNNRRFDEPDLDELLNVIEQIRPEWSDQLRQLREEHPRDFFDALRRNDELRRIMGLLALKERAPEVFEMRLRELQLSVKVQHLAYAAQKAEQDGNAVLAATKQAELAEAVDAYFDARIVIRKHELQRVRDQLERMESDLTSTIDNRDSLIEGHLNKLLSPDSFEDLQAAQGPMTTQDNGDDDTPRRWRNRGGDRDGNGGPNGGGPGNGPGGPDDRGPREPEGPRPEGPHNGPRNGPPSDR